MDALLNITYPILIAKEQTRLLRDPFYAAYGAAYDGRRPFVDPVPLVRWGFGDQYPDSALQEANNNRKIFRVWFNSNVLVHSNDPNAACSNRILVYPSNGPPQIITPRNQYLSSASVPFGLETARFSSFAEVPDFVIPVGQASYFSNITNHTEELPVTVDIVAAKGCDGMLFSLAEILVSRRILKPSVTGRSDVDGGGVLFR